MAIIIRNWREIVLITLVALLFWTIIVCYPNPYILIRNFVRYMRFPVDPSIVDLIDSRIPDDPIEIETFVETLIKYEYDWKNYGVPWYVPIAQDAVIRRRGDCESRAMVFASLLEAKHIPYSMKASLIHIWVDYAGKKPNESENEGVSFIRKVDGRYRLKLPDLSRWRQYLGLEKEMLWDAMPDFRKMLMVTGWVLIIFSFLFGWRMIRNMRGGIDREQT